MTSMTDTFEHCECGGRFQTHPESDDFGVCAECGNEWTPPTGSWTEADVCGHYLGNSESLSVTCKRPKGHVGPHRSAFEIAADEAKSKRQLPQGSVGLSERRCKVGEALRDEEGES